MKNRISVYVGPPLAGLLEKEENVSGRLNQIADRYLALVKKEALELTDEEKTILTAVLTGSLIDILFIEYLHDEVADCTEFEGKTLAQKLKNISFAQKLATIEAMGF